MRTGTAPEETQGLRLVMLSGGEKPSHQRVELVHETLLHKVPSLVIWIEQERALLERQEGLEAAARVWQQAGHPSKGLPTGTLLTHYRGGPAVKQGGTPSRRKVNSLAARFLQAAEQLERRHAWIQRALVAASLMAGLTILVFATRAEQERQIAEQSRRLAERAQQYAEQERQRAEENLRQIIAVTDQFVGDSDWKLSRLPYTLEERRKVLQGYRQTLESLPAEERARQEVRLALIRVHQRLADLAFHNETLADAGLLLGAALEELRAGLARQADAQALREELALNHSKRGKVALARADWAASRDHFTQALALLETPGVKSDNAENFRRTLAVSLTELAEVDSAQGDLKGAAARYDRAISLHEQNSGAYNQYVLALTLGDRAEVAHRAGDTEAAERYVRRALHLGQACVQSQQGNQLYRWVLARTYVKLGALQGARGLPEAAQRSYDEALKLSRALREGESSNKRYTLVLVEALLGLGHSVEGCELAREFRQRDSEDIRFQFTECQGPQEEK
jgi:tetratricopeptide (TPR) repeat protein